MRVNVLIKTLRRDRGFLEPTVYEVPDSTATLRDLITDLVDQEMARYNSRRPGELLTAFLTNDQIAHMAEVGKVDFGLRHIDTKVDTAEAEANALQCFEDGIVRVVAQANEEAQPHELTHLDDTIPLTDGATYTFVRLTFLAGRMW